MDIPEDNPMTVQGVALGRHLFYEKRLSADNTQSCGSCHGPAFSFTDNGLRYSKGIDGIEGTRNSMPLINLGFFETFFWDGRSSSLEIQAFEPIVNPIEMHETWPNAVSKIENDEMYLDMFEMAFGERSVDSVKIVKAIAQFERTMISGNSRFDKHLRGEITLTAEELEGFNIFMDEERGDCFHCHGSNTNPLWTDDDFHNNGLDATFSDLGLGAVTGNATDNGKFKTPTLRNLVFTAPYMHDGRFNTLEEVVDHYSDGLKGSATIDPLMKTVQWGGVGLSNTEKENLIAFLKTLTDSSFVTNPLFHDPFN